MKQTNRGKTQILGKSKYQGKVTRHGQAPELFQDECQEPSGMPGTPPAECGVSQRAGHRPGLVTEIHPPDIAQVK